MKRIAYITLLLTTLALTVKAGQLGYSEKRPLLFGIDMDYPPMEYVGADGIPSGYDVEFTKRVMERLGVPFTYAPNTWENIADDILEGHVDLGMMVYSPYRKDMTNFSRAVFKLYYQLVTRKDGQKMNGLRDADDKTFALMRSRPIIDTLTKVGAKTVIVTDLTKAMTDLSAGKYDAVICFRYQARYIIGKRRLGNLTATDLALTPREYCYVSHDKQLIDSINVILDQLEEEGVIDEVYASVKTKFGGISIPVWVWYLLGAVLLVSLIVVIILQKRYQQRLLREMQRAQKSEQLKTIFLSNVSHALRTPLNAVIGFSDLLMMQGPDGIDANEQQNLLGLINENGKQLLHYIEELLQLSDVEGGDEQFHRVETGLTGIMEEIAAATRAKINKPVKLQVVGNGGTVVLDPNLLRFILSHLLDNAIQNTDEGTITLSYSNKDNGFYAEVKDTGRGIPEDLKENIFGLLSEKNTSVQNRLPGLGLSICYAIMLKAGGRMGVESPATGGTTVWLWAPNKIRY